MKAFRYRIMATGSLVIVLLVIWNFFTSTEKTLTAPTTTMRYTIIDLGVLPGDNSSSAMAINNAGQVVGSSLIDHTPYTHKAFLWATDLMTNLHPVVTNILPNVVNSTAFNISDDGKIVGYANEHSNNTYPLLWEDTQTLHVLPTLNTDEYYNGHVRGISDNGDYMVGASLGRVCMWWHDSSTYIVADITGSFAGGAARAVNDYGIVSGGAKINSSDLYEVPVRGSIHGLEQINPAIGLGTDINNNGTIVGSIDKSTIIGTVEWEAFMWHNSVITKLGFLTNTYGFNLSGAQSVNNHGVIVGASYLSQTLSHAVIWSNGIITDLNSISDLGVFDHLVVASDINDNGWIVGGGYIDGKPRAFLAIPYQVEPTPTPTNTPTETPIPTATPTTTIILPTPTISASIFLPIVIREISQQQLTYLLPHPPLSITLTNTPRPIATKTPVPENVQTWYEVSKTLQNYADVD